MSTVFIYALNDPDTGRTRYIGKAADPYARYECHLDNNPKERTHKACWIRSLLQADKTPVLEILDEVPESEWQFWECEWIRLYWALGFRLTNGTAGGDGVVGAVCSLETRSKLSAAHKGKPKSAKHCASMSAARKGKPFSEGHCLNLSAALTGRKLSKEHSQKIGIFRKGKPSLFLGKKHTTEANQKRSESMRRTWEKRNASV